MIQYKCGRCGEQLESPEFLIGQSEKCPKCGEMVTIPPPPINSPPPPISGLGPSVNYPSLPVGGLGPPAEPPHLWGLVGVGILGILVGGVLLADATLSRPENILQQNVMTLREIEGAIYVATGVLLVAVADAVHALCRFAAKNFLSWTRK